jgi:FkbM family methyltransferase
VKKLAAKLMSNVASGMLTWLRNGEPVHLSRDEIRFAQFSFGQYGEDLAVLRWVEQLAPASLVYVDVGCFHPVHFSNTLLLHKRGWRGVNVDLNAARIAEFQRLRAGDYNVIAAVSSEERELSVAEYAAGLTDRLVEPDQQSVTSLIGEAPTGTRPVRTKTLDGILQSCPWPVPGIGYLNIDCEGHDLEVLKGLDLARYRPAVITIEAFPDQRGAILEYLGMHEFERKETICNTLVFVAPHARAQ